MIKFNVAVASSIINTTSMISNPDDVMDTYSVVVTCEINPTSTAEYCEVIARNDDAGKPARSSKLQCTNTCTHVCMLAFYMHSYVCIYICKNKTSTTCIHQCV